MKITVPPLVVPPLPAARQRRSVWAETGDVTVFTTGKDSMCIRVKGLSRVDPSKETKGANGRGSSDGHLKLPEAEQLYADLGKIINELKERSK